MPAQLPYTTPGYYEPTESGTQTPSWVYTGGFDPYSYYPTVTPSAEYPQWAGYFPPITKTPVGETPAPAPAPAPSLWSQWRPYLEGLGIVPLPSGHLTATSPAFRSRMNPLAIQAMQEYYTNLGKTWADYENWANAFLPRTPILKRRIWRPVWW